MSPRVEGQAGTSHQVIETIITQGWWHRWEHYRSAEKRGQWGVEGIGRGFREEMAAWGLEGWKELEGEAEGQSRCGTEKNKAGGKSV